MTEWVKLPGNGSWHIVLSHNYYGTTKTVCGLRRRKFEAMINFMLPGVKSCGNCLRLDARKRQEPS